MFKGREKWVIYTSIIIALVVLSVLIVRQLQYAYNLRMMYLRGETAGFPVPDYQHIMLMNETFSKTFFLIFFCFWVILFGALILFTQADKVHQQHGVEKTRVLWRAISPGLVMVVAGTLILAFAIYQHRDLKFSMPLSMQDLRIPDAKMTWQPLQKDTATIALISPDEDTIVVTKAATAQAANAVQVKPPAPQPKKAEAVRRPSRQRTLRRHREVAAAPVQQQQTDRTTHTAQPVQQLSPAPATFERENTPVTPEELRWADQLADKVVIFGHTPSGPENSRYLAIYNRMLEDKDSSFALTDKHWAFGFAQKLQRGYQPLKSEMTRFEEIAYENAKRTVAR